MNQLGRFFGNMDCVCGNRGDGVPFVQDLVMSEHVRAQMTHVDRTFAQLDHPIPLGREIGRRHDGAHAGECLCLRNVDSLDARVGMRAAQDDAWQQSCQLNVGSVLGSAGDLVDAIVSDRTSSNDLIFRLAVRRHDLISCQTFTCHTARC